MDIQTLHLAKKHADEKIATTNSNVSGIDTRVTSVESNLSSQDQATATLNHGLNVLNSSQSSPLKVEFHPESRINHMGREGGFHKQGKWGTNLTIDTSTYKFGTSSGKIDNSAGTGSKIATNSQQLNLSGKYILFGVWAKANSGTPNIDFHLIGNSTSSYNVNTDFNIDSSWKFYYVKADLTSATTDYFTARLDVDSYGTSNDIVNFDGMVIYELTSTVYNKIGVSLTDSDVERMFPYVDSIKGVSRPYVKVSGSNLVSGFPTWENKSAVPYTVSSEYKIEVDGSSTKGAVADLIFDVVANQTYTFKGLGASSSIKYIIYERDTNGVESTSLTISVADELEHSFTTKSTTAKVRILIYSYANGTFVMSQPMLNLGSTALPFTEKNDSYLMLETTLYGNSNVKDILHEVDGVWYKEKNWETDVKLDSSLAWVFGGDKTGFKDVYFSLTGGVTDSATVVKYDGKILERISSGTASSKSDQQVLHSLERMYITIDDTDSGWLDAWTGTELTSDWISAYFNGWSYNGDGTTHSWVSLVDGTAPSTNTLAYVSANQAPNYENYFLSYQLASSVTEPISVEGSLNIASGGSIVTTGVGMVNREEVTPYYDSSTDRYFINLDVFSSSHLNNKPIKIIDVYRNGNEDNYWDIVKSQSAYGGKTYAKVDGKGNVDTTATYTVTYEILDKYNSTTNINEVLAFYASSLKSSFDRVVEKLSDQGTSISVLEKQVILLDARLDSGGL